MVQFYFLSVLLNVVGGYSLVIAKKPPSEGIVNSLNLLLLDARARLVLGILSIITGTFKLISPMRGDMRIVGDLLPALTGLLVGAVLLLELHHGPDTPFRGEGDDSTELSDESTRVGYWATPLAARKPHKFEELLITSGAAIGYAAIFAGVMHFLFPMELFL